MSVNRHSSSTPFSDVPSPAYADVLTEPVLDTALMRLLTTANTPKTPQSDGWWGRYANLQAMSDGMDVIEHSLPDGFDAQQFLALLNALH